MSVLSSLSSGRTAFSKAERRHDRQTATLYDVASEDFTQMP